MYWKAFADMTTTVSALSVLRFNDQQAHILPVAPSISFDAADPMGGVFTTPVEVFPQSVALIGTKQTLELRLIKAPTLYFELLAALFAGVANRLNPSRIIFATNLLTRESIRGTQPLTQLIASFKSVAQRLHVTLSRIEPTIAISAAKLSDADAIRANHKRSAAFLANNRKQCGHSRILLSNIIPHCIGNGTAAFAARDRLRMPFEAKRVQAENDLAALPLFAAFVGEKLV